MSGNSLEAAGPGGSVNLEAERRVRWRYVYGG